MSALEKTMVLRFAAKAMAVDGVTIYGELRASRQTAVEPTFIEDREPNFIGYHFENEENQKIAQEKISPNQKVTLVIKTQQAEGKSIQINLNDSRLDFIHNNKVLENDILKGIKVTGAETRVALTTIKE